MILWGDGGTEMVDATEVEVGRSSDAVDVRLKRSFVAEDDTQTLDLRGRGKESSWQWLVKGCAFWIVLV